MSLDFGAPWKHRVNLLSNRHVTPASTPKARLEPTTVAFFAPAMGSEVASSAARMGCGQLSALAQSGHSHFQLFGKRLAMMLTTLNVITISLA